jgi:hypothetical protein
VRKTNNETTLCCQKVQRAVFLKKLLKQSKSPKLLIKIIIVRVNKKINKKKLKVNEKEKVDKNVKMLLTG